MNLLFVATNLQKIQNFMVKSSNFKNYRKIEIVNINIMNKL